MDGLAEKLNEIKEFLEDDDKENLGKLIRIVNEASQKNENIAKVVDNAKQIGGKVADLAMKYLL